jgi:hypothetical protein
MLRYSAKYAAAVAAGADARAVLARCLMPFQLAFAFR